MKNASLFIIIVASLAALAAPAAAYTVILRDGSQLIAQDPPVFEGDQAIIVLRSGTRTSIAADEIDMERTREANLHELGSAMVLENGEFKGQVQQPVPPQEERLSDLIGKRPKGGVVSRAPVARDSNTSGRPSGRSGLVDYERKPYRDLEVLEAIQGAFRSQGVDAAKIYLGTSEERLLIEVETNSEAAVFRTLKVAAGALTHVRTNISATIEAFELVLTTASRSRAGEFLMTTEQASALVGGEVDLPTYFVEQVRF